MKASKIYEYYIESVMAQVPEQLKERLTKSIDFDDWVSFSTRFKLWRNPGAKNWSISFFYDKILEEIENNIRNRSNRCTSKKINHLGNKHLVENGAEGFGKEGLQGLDAIDSIQLWYDLPGSIMFDSNTYDQYVNTNTSCIKIVNQHPFAFLKARGMKPSKNVLGLYRKVNVKKWGDVYWLNAKFAFKDEKSSGVIPYGDDYIYIDAQRDKVKDTNAAINTLLKMRKKSDDARFRGDRSESDTYHYDTASLNTRRELTLQLLDGLKIMTINNPQAVQSKRFDGVAGSDFLIAQANKEICMHNRYLIANKKIKDLTQQQEKASADEFKRLEKIKSAIRKNALEKRL